MQFMIDDNGLLDLLMRENLLSQAGASRAAAASSEAGALIERSLVEFGLVAEEDLFAVLARHLDLPFLQAEEIEPNLAHDLGVPLEFLQRLELIPAQQGDDGIVVATANPRAKDALASLAFHLRMPVQPAIATPSTIKAALHSSHATKDDDAGQDAASRDVERLTALANNGPIIKLVNDLISEAADEGASDIHLEAGEAELRVRFRVDGHLRAYRRISQSQRAAVVSRLKVMAKLNISEKRRPQDGRTQLTVRGRPIDIRLSTLPTQFGESIVLRLLDRKRVVLDWQGLGYPAGRVAEIEQVIRQPNGIFLVAGPTGSGKTTTLYTALNSINSEDRKIVTVEDPIEYSLVGVNQVNVDPAIDMSFARALRAILRQDPDVIMVGEIRDQETAEIAVRAALVGRLVLSTIHTNDAVSAVTRLIDLGVPSFLLAATLRGVLSQRLVRTRCDACFGKGCEMCNDTGMRGRAALSEFLPITEGVRQDISDGKPQATLAETARVAGFETMAQAAQEMVEAGQLSPQEMLRILGEASGTGGRV